MTITDFLIKFRKLAERLIEDDQKNDVIKQLAEAVFSNQSLLDESEACVSLVSSLARNLESADDTENLKARLFDYWCYLIQACKIDLFYICHRDNLYALDSAFDPVFLNGRYYIEPKADGSIDEKSFEQELSNSHAPFIIYDAWGAAIIKSSLCSKVLGVIPLFELMFRGNLAHNSNPSNVAHMLMHSWQRLDNSDIDTVIIGNSYAWYAFPESMLKRSSNLSTHSLSIRQYVGMSERLLSTHPHIRNYVFCGGHFEFYYDLLRSTENFNVGILREYSQFTAAAQMSLLNANEPWFFPLEDSTLLAYLAPFRAEITSERILSIENEKIRGEALAYQKQSVESRVSLNQAEMDVLAESRGKGASKSVRYDHTFDDNTRLFARIKENLLAAGKQIIWITPPFPPAYNDNVVEKMKKNNRDQLQRLTAPGFVFYDLSTHSDFNTEDYRDGDHLNANGAAKLLAILRGEGIKL
ncbi:hypothetical protein [Siccibacter turicensis]|uniref:hypothetical protein n=1 Tax=Siccibacter turicensis TaxID=357233 RepID=UPI0023F247D4|nr:hypothetical protein [Siccibacter turicensis]